MMKTIFKFLITSIIFALSTQTICAQKDGIGGYGELQYNFLLNNKYPNQYLLGGGGVVINNNIMFGGYVGTIINMYTSQNDFPDTSIKNNISHNPYSLSTQASISDFGVNIGFNVNSQKDFQLLLSLKTGLSILNLKDNTFSSDYIEYLQDTSSSLKVPSSLLEVQNYNAIGFNAMPQIAIQFYVGKSMKLFSNFGYRLVIINNQYNNPLTKKQESVLVDRWMFNSMFINIGVSFGSF